jgi:hypothetical protein
MPNLFRAITMLPESVSIIELAIRLVNLTAGQYVSVPQQAASEMGVDRFAGAGFKPP